MHVGVPSGRALLPDSLDSADELAGNLSPVSLKTSAGDHAAAGPSGRGAGRSKASSGRRTADLEAELEAEFFAVVCRDAEEVVAEELAAAGISPCIQLAPILLLDIFPGREAAAVRLLAGSGCSMGHDDSAPGTSPRPLAGASSDRSERLLPALMAAWPQLVASKAVLQLQVGAAVSWC